MSDPTGKVVATLHKFLHESAISYGDSFDHDSTPYGSHPLVFQSDLLAAQAEVERLAIDCHRLQLFAMV